MNSTQSVRPQDTPPIWTDKVLCLLMKLLRKKHSFHRITAPTHIIGTPPHSLRHHEPILVSSTTGHTSYMDGQDSTSLCLINEISRKKTLFSPYHCPHTHYWDSSSFTKVQRTQPSPFNHRIHPQYGQTRMYFFMALLTKSIGKKHSFHRITSPTHILGTPPLSLRHNELNPVCQDTPPIWTNKVLCLYGFLKKTLFSPYHLPHTHYWGSSPFIEAQPTQPSLFDHRTHTRYGRTRL